MLGITKIIWAVAIVLMFANSIYYSFKLKFPQFRIKKLLKVIFSKEEKDGISSKDSLFISLASKLGAGSLAGISFAIYYGGVGTVFWMWVSALFVSVNSFLETSTSIMYKEKDGEFYKGGPAYYIKKGLNKQKLALIYVALTMFAYIVGFLSMQTNTISTLVNEIYKIDKVIISLVISGLSFIIIVKGLKIISDVCNKIVPTMTIIYFLAGLIICLINLDKIPNVLFMIVKDAFKISSMSGGIVYSLIIGIQKALFATEAGVGTGAIASGASSNNDYVKQGYMGIIETYFITLITITVTSLMVILSDYTNLSFVNMNGVELTKYAISYHLGHFGEIILLIILILFSFSTIITGYYYGESSMKYLTKNKKMVTYLKIFALITLFLGGITSSNIIWAVVDLSVGVLAIINIYTLFSLRKKILPKLLNK